MINAIRNWWTRVKDFWDMTPCPKEEMGYTCRHRVLSNGELECGSDYTKD